MSTAGFLLLQQVLRTSYSGRSTTPSIPPRRRPYASHHTSEGAAKLAADLSHMHRARVQPGSGCLNILDYVPERGDHSIHVHGFTAIDPNGTRWKTTEGRWDLDHLHYRHSL